MSAAVSPVPRLTFFANDGTPLSGGNVYTYAAGTTTPQTTWSDEALTVAISNPIILNAAGRPTASSIDTTEVNVYLSAVSYKFVVKDSMGTTIYTADHIEAVSPNPVGVIAFPVSVSGGTSGAVPYFSSTTVLSSSLLLAAHSVMVGGGAGVAPKTITAGTTGQLLVGATGADPAFASPAGAGASQILLHRGSGTSTAAGATTVDSIALTGLTVDDQLMIVSNVESIAQNTATAVLYSVTDSTQVGYQNSNTTVTSGTGFYQTALLGPRQGSSVLLATYTSGGSYANSAELISGIFTVTTLWTANWTLGLRHGGVTSGGTFKYAWSVYRILGQ